MATVFNLSVAIEIANELDREVWMLPVSILPVTHPNTISLVKSV